MSESNGNGFVITKETWDHMPKEQRDWILFDTMQRLTSEVKCLKRWNKGMGFCGGIVGGIVAFFGVKMA
ncbi:MAG: hypothetical protein WC455_17315 [Dehalococcoidia bacterium]|jgi:hypothetical protein